MSRAMPKSAIFAVRNFVLDVSRQFLAAISLSKITHFTGNGPTITPHQVRTLFNLRIANRAWWSYNVERNTKHFQGRLSLAPVKSRGQNIPAETVNAQLLKHDYFCTLTKRIKLHVASNVITLEVWQKRKTWIHVWPIILTLARKLLIKPYNILYHFRRRDKTTLKRRQHWESALLGPIVRCCIHSSEI